MTQGAEDVVRWLDALGSDDLAVVGGKGASLGEMTSAGLPVPPGFVVTAGSYRSFIEETGIAEELFEAVDVDSDDSGALAEAESRAEQLILGTEMPEPIREAMLDAYADLDDGDAFVAVRSSATAEDLPDASFAGQQETFLNIQGEKLIQRVKECWASLFTQRAIYYRNEQGFDHEAVDIAVVVQRMVDAEKSGVLFTSHPSTGEPKLIIEAAWGLGEAVVSGSVSPDNYVIDRETGEVLEHTVADKKLLMEKDPETGQTVEREVSEEKRTAPVLESEEIDRLVELADDHYPDAECIRVVVDQLNTHNPAGFYRFFPPDEAHAYLDRFEFHYVPKNGSWLNMAEIELGVLKRQCLDRRIYYAATLRSEVAAWQEHRNAADRLIDWQFTTDDARIKLRRLYPVEIELEEG